MIKRGQISIEYLIVVGFVSFLVITILALGYFYSAGVKDQIEVNQLSSFASKIVDSAESIYYAGEPSKLTINAYLPSGVQSMSVETQGIFINVTSSSGTRVMLFSSKVPLSGSLTINEGVKSIRLAANEDGVTVNDG